MPWSSAIARQRRTPRIVPPKMLLGISNVETARETMKIFTAMIAAAAIFGATTASAEVLDPKGIKTTGEYNEHGTKYPVTGFRGLPWSMHWEDMKDQGTTQSNRYKRLLTWAEDNGVEIDAVPNTEYSYTTVVGPGAPLEAKNMWAGTFSFEPGAVYGVGQHASWEIYLVVKGQADFYNYDKVTHAKEGTWMPAGFDLKDMSYIGNWKPVYKAFEEYQALETKDPIRIEGDKILPKDFTNYKERNQFVRYLKIR